MKISPLLLLSLACLSPPGFAQDGTPPDLAVALAETKKTALPLLPKVVGAMQAAVAAKGAAGAIPVCRVEAPTLLQAMRQQTGWEIRRVSLKTRNPATGTPDAWEVRQLADFNIRAANGEKPEQIEVSAVIDEGGGKRSLRYMKALPTAPVCLQCHGPAESLGEDLRQSLARDYPDDRALGYAAGQVRGALSVRRPL
ncbi:Tll0287-like domain-containing protein [Rhodocyclus tenuis]|uniref:Tll0287-like domain-containing protein n=1 Tax=Rhodocyclus tenuis TaxID=1066 RepID=UPI001907397B|nr:DUF3365 domain-containing protein [Rhodocyclus tenuis]MBK1680999.1 hypothetical protein [Rhodocyclus tenuis]